MSNTALYSLLSPDTDQYTPNSDEQPVPIFEVVLANGMWWPMPEDLSQMFFEKYDADEDAVYTWGWASHALGLGSQTTKRRPPTATSSISKLWSNETSTTTVADLYVLSGSADRV